jgi:hypothetical protein
MPPDAPKCPAACKANFDLCVKKYTTTSNDKQYAIMACLKYAENGNLCSVGKCDADDFTKETCPDVQVFTSCGSCQATCDRPFVPCTKMCHEGCFCPDDLSLWDDASEKCVAANDCPDEGACETSIGANFQATGAAAITCKAHDVDDDCAATTCQKGCVPSDDAGAEDKWLTMCGAMSTQTSCTTSKYNTKDHTYCQWADGTGSPPTFVCADNDGGSWVVRDEGSCGAGGGAGMSMCDYFDQTGCLNSGCNLDVKDECGGLLKATMTSCSIPCFMSRTPEQQTKCATCVDDQMMSTSTIDPAVSDIVSCCGCISTNLGMAGMSDAQMADMFEDMCTPDPPVDSWDDDWRK